MSRAAPDEKNVRRHEEQGATMSKRTIRKPGKGRRNDRRHAMLAGACAVGLISGCATTTNEAALDTPKNEIRPLYRVQQPAGTAAGQYAVGRLDLAEGRVDAAIERFRNALTLDPNYVPAHNGLGVAYGQQGRFGEAAAAFRVALAAGPASAHVLNNLGYAQMQTGQLAEAWKSLERSFRIEPANARTRANLRQLAQLQLAAAPATASATPAGNGPMDAQGAQPAAAAAIAVEPVPVREAMPVLDELIIARATTGGAAVTEPVAEEAAGPVAETTAGPVAVAVAATEPVAAPASGSARLSPTASAPARTTGPATAEVPASSVAAESEVVLSRTGRMALVRVAPNVYAMRIVTEEPLLPQMTPPVAIVRPSPQLASGTPPQMASPTLPQMATRTAVGTVPSMSARTLSRDGSGVVPHGTRTASKKRVPAPSAATAAPGLTARQDALSAAAVPEKPARIEVSNGAGVNRLATRTAQQLRRLGAVIQRITNHRPFDRQYTVIEYRDGHLASAENLQHRLPVSAKLVPSAQMHPGVNVRLVLGRDMVAGPMARWLGTEVVVQASQPEGAESL